MPHAWPAALLLHLRQGVQMPTRLLRIKPWFRAPFGLTTFNDDLDFDDGNGLLTYSAKPGLEISDIVQTLGAGSDTAQASFAVDSIVIDGDELLCGELDKAEFALYVVKHDELGLGFGIELAGEISDVELEGGRVSATLGSLMEKYQTKRGTKRVSPRCDFSFATFNLERGQFCHVSRTGEGAWIADTVMTPHDFLFWGPDPVTTLKGSVRTPTVYNDRIYMCDSVSGDFKTGLVEPVWSTVIDALVPDDGVSWIVKQAMEIPFEVNAAVGNDGFTILPIGGNPVTDAPDEWLRHGVILFDTGDNQNQRREIRSWDLAGKQVRADKAYKTITAGDQGRLLSGCPRDQAGCKARFNYDGFGGAGILAPSADDVFEVTRD